MQWIQYKRRAEGTPLLSPREEVEEVGGRGRENLIKLFRNTQGNKLRWLLALLLFYQRLAFHYKFRHRLCFDAISDI